MNVRRRPLIASSLALLALPRATFAQQPGKVWRIGYLTALPRPPDGFAPAPLRKSLQELGYAEGKDVVIVGRWAEGRTEQLDALAGELLAAKVDVIVAPGGPVAAAAKRATSVTPIIAFNAGDMVETGLVASLARPGRNVTGINDPATALSAKRLEILRELVPAAKRVAVLWNTNDNAMTLRYREIERAAKVMSVGIDPLGLRVPDDFDVAMAGMIRSRPDALMMVNDSLTTMNRQRVLDFAARQQIPGIFEAVAMVQAGGLMSYGADLNETFKLVASYVVKILRGANPGDMPVEQPNRYYFVVNLKTAKALGLTFPQSLLLRADEVIQ